MEFLSILTDIHIHLDPKPLPCHVCSNPASAFTLASEPLSGSDRPFLWERNNKIIPTLMIILLTSASCSPTLQISHLFQLSYPSGPPYPPPKRGKLPSGDTDWLSTMDQCLRTLVANTSRVFLGSPDSETGQRTNFSITTSAAFTSLSAM